MPLSVGSPWQAFEETACARGNVPALVFADEIISFAELKTDAERCATWLALSGVRSGSIVVLQLPKQRATYALWLGCLRQGVTYAFLDPRNPPQRTEQILNRLKPAILVAVTCVENAYGQAISLPSAEASAAWLRKLPGAPIPPPAPVHGLDPAYVMFTSGSTGEPKGAVIPQQGILSLMRWGRTLADPSAERFSNLNPLHFDNSVFDLYCGLLNGAALVPVETSTTPNPAHWVKRLREGGATVIFAVPTLFQTLQQLKLLRPESLPDARLFIFGGEGFPVATLRTFGESFVGRARLLNVYGPTETSCICSSIEIDAELLAGFASGFPPLGHMHDDFAHAILDEEGTEVPIGSIGELWIGGGNVGLGYFGSPEETGRRFRQDPRQSLYRSIWYRSGDLVRKDEDGLLWFHGRADNQVKVRGHRIELEEIDLALESMENVTRAVAAIAVGPDGPEILAAFVGQGIIPVEQVRAHCLAKLPPYMQPARIVQLERLPTNANGKVDRRATLDLLDDSA